MAPKNDGAANVPNFGTFNDAAENNLRPEKKAPSFGQKLSVDVLCTTLSFLLQIQVEQKMMSEIRENKILRETALCLLEGISQKRIKEILSSENDVLKKLKAERRNHLIIRASSADEQNALLNQEIQMFSSDLDEYRKAQEEHIKQIEKIKKERIRERRKVEKMEEQIETYEKQLRRIAPLEELNKEYDEKIRMSAEKIKELTEIIEQKTVNTEEESQPEPAAAEKEIQAVTDSKQVADSPAADAEPASEQTPEQTSEESVPAVNWFARRKQKRAAFEKKKERNLMYLAFKEEILENKDYSTDTKDYLLRCLESGDTMEQIRQYASPQIDRQFMERMRQIYKNRENGGKKK